MTKVGNDPVPSQSGKPRNGKLRVPLKFEDALRAALDTPPEDPEPAKPKSPAVDRKADKRYHQAKK